MVIAATNFEPLISAIPGRKSGSIDAEKTQTRGRGDGRSQRHSRGRLRPLDRESPRNGARRSGDRPTQPRRASAACGRTHLPDLRKQRRTGTSMRKEKLLRVGRIHVLNDGTEIRFRALTTIEIERMES